jgi:dihydrolipoamide dehydrogenase
MGNLIEIKVPDIGDFKDVEIIEVLVKPGDAVDKEASLIVLESDKATMEVPSPQAGVVKDIRVKVGDKVSEGSLILNLDAPGAETKALQAPAPQANQDAASQANTIEKPAQPRSPAGMPAQRAAAPSADVHTEVLVLGAGPGGYTAAFRAADLGKQVTLVERYALLGGVCLNVGCIPSKALLHVAKVISDAHDMSKHGVSFGAPNIDMNQVRGWKESVVGKLTKGLAGLSKQRKVNVVTGKAQFASPNTLRVETAEGVKTVSFDHCIIAAGSQAFKPPGLPWDDPRLMDSTDALELREIPKRMLIVGGGIIGLEMATVYDALGTKITVVELMDQLIPGADPDIVKPLARRIEKRYEKILLKTKVTKLEATGDGLKAYFEGANAIEPQIYDRVLVAVGRKPNGKLIDAQAAGVHVDERGYIPVDKQQRTNVPHIFAIGDIVGEPMLAHKATHEAKIAAEVIAGHKAAFDARTIPNVAYTDPEIAWMGVSEPEAKAQGLEYDKAAFPWAASGRALGQARDEGLTKLIFDKKTRRILGAGIVGPNAGELIAETVLALEMGADAEDIGLTIHPHPTLSETIFFASEIAEGTITDLYMPRKK